MTSGHTPHQSASRRPGVVVTHADLLDPSSTVQELLFKLHSCTERDAGQESAIAHLSLNPVEVESILYSFSRVKREFAHFHSEVVHQISPDVVVMVAHPARVDSI